MAQESTPMQIARATVAGFDRHYRRFSALNAEARKFFEKGDWVALRGAQQDRIFSYDARVREAVAALTEEFPQVRQEKLWPTIKQAYVGLLLDHQQPECAETFFNSVVTRVLSRRYYTNQYLFWRPAVSTEHIEGWKPTYHVYYPATLGLAATLRAVLHDIKFESPWENQEADLAKIRANLRDLLPERDDVRPNFQVHVLASPFLRGKAAYVIGRVRNGLEEKPFAVAILKNAKGQLYVDAFLVGHADLVMLFSLAHAYFMVEMEVPAAYVSFLKSIFPGKPNAELYTVLGLQKQGKTLFYRDLHFHLRHSTDKFIIAPGVKGMVMAVFTLPSFPYVFKVIRDKFEQPKDTDRESVMKQYLHVKLHDRVGRMADTLEYSDVALPLDRFSPELLAELKEKCPSWLEIDREQIVIKHLYIERRMVPLDMYMNTHDEKKTAHAVREYGNAIRELAGANIFPGDLLLKNFGMTRAGRVVFYDYDELARVTDCRFRRLPTYSDDDDDGLRPGGDAYYVDKNDVFPEELPNFIFANEKTRALFMKEHGDLATPEFWLEKQEQLRKGVEDHVYPYPQARRFKRDA